MSDAGDVQLLHFHTSGGRLTVQKTHSVGTLRKNGGLLPKSIVKARISRDELIEQTGSGIVIHNEVCLLLEYFRKADCYSNAE